MAFNYNASTKSYNYTPKDDPKDKVEVEVGDAMDSSQFFPQVKIKRWDNEANASIRLKYDNIPGNISYSDDGTKITWKKGQWSAIFYDKPDASDEGGFEFEIHIPNKPPVNYLVFTVNTKSLNWFYQPPLTQEEIDRGDIRPDNVVGSYAVYHKTKGVFNRIDGMNYGVGKAFHIYRPHVVDANGNSTYANLNINEATGTLTITVDQTWLNSAIYPIVVDPTFGYTGTPASGVQIGNALAGGRFTISENGTGVSMSKYGTRTLLDKNFKCNVYDNGSGDTDTSVSQITNGVTEQGVTVAGPSSVTVNFVSAPSFVSGTSYRLFAFGATGAGAHTITKDASIAGEYGYTQTGLTYSTFPDPTNLTATSQDRYGIYVTYTAAGGTPDSAYHPEMTLNFGYWGSD